MSYTTTLFGAMLLLLSLTALSEGASLMTLTNDTGIALPGSWSGSIRDVYADPSKDVFILLTSNGIYQYDHARTTIKASFQGLDCCQGQSPRGFHDQLASSNNHIYVLKSFGVNTRRSDSEEEQQQETRANPNYQVWRFDVTNVTQYAIYNVTYIHNGPQMAVDTARGLGFLVSQNDPWVEIVDLTTMTYVNHFNYTQGTYPDFRSAYPGGWLIVADSVNKLLYIGVDCDTPTPGIIWQYDVSNTLSPVYQQNTVFASDPCFFGGFIDPADNRLWTVEDDAGWIGSFASDDLSWGSLWSFSTAEYVEAFTFDASTHTAYFIDQGTGANPNYPGYVYRVCTQDYGNYVHEKIRWQNSKWNSRVEESFLDTQGGVLYVVSENSFVTTISIASGTDCPSQPPTYKCSSGSQLTSPFAALRELLF